MSFHIDPPLRHGGHLMVSISEVYVSTHHLGGIIAGHAQKTPRLVVVYDGRDMRVVSVGPMPVPSGASALIPDAAEALRDAAASNEFEPP